MSQNKGAHLSGWPGSRHQSPCLEEASSLCCSLIWWPNLGTDTKHSKALSTVSGVWDTATPIKLWVLILHMTPVGNGPMDSPKAPGSQPPSLICKTGI